MFTLVLVAILGWSVLGVFVNLLEVGWSLWYMRRHPIDIVMMFAAAAAGILVGQALGLV